MKANQLNKGIQKRLLYIENKDGLIDGASARIGWVTFSKTGKTLYYRGKKLQSSRGRGILGNHFDTETGEEYWISGIKTRGSNTHYEPVKVIIDKDAYETYLLIKSIN